MFLLKYEAQYLNKFFISQFEVMKPELGQSDKNYTMDQSCLC